MNRANARRLPPLLLAVLAWLAPASARSASSHPDRGGDCESCHPCGKAATVNAPICHGCHDGDGTALGGATPSLTMGWSDPSTIGDAHGAAGSISPIDCSSCHGGHTSPSAFVLAAGSSGASISREGVGAEQLCSRCHASRHQGCATDCHTFHVGDPMPDGAPCFQCHGHDFTLRTFFSDGTDQPWYCLHCHRGGFHPSISPPPAIADVRVVTGYDRARVVWRTSSDARAALEWGTTELTRMTENRWYGMDQFVLLTGLVEGVPYAFRPRVNDVRREVVRSAPGTFTPGVASIPRPSHTNAQFLTRITPMITRFGWYEETEPPALPVTYEWQLASSTTFSPLVAGGETTQDAVTITLPVGGTWYYRVRARFTDRATWSAWSALGSFQTVWCTDCD